MLIKKPVVLNNIKNLLKVRLFSSSVENLEDGFIMKRVIKKVPLKVKVIKKIPVIYKTPSANIDIRCLDVEKILKVKKSVIENELLPVATARKILIKKKALRPKIKKIWINEIVKVLKKRIIKGVRVVKKKVLKVKKKKKVLKKVLKVKKKKKVLKKVLKVKKKTPKLIPLGPMPDFYKLKKTKRVSFVGISFRQNRRLVHKPWLKKFKKKKFKGPPPLKGRIRVTFRVGKRKTLKNGKKIGKRHYIGRWKYVFARRNKNRNKKRVYLFYNRKRNNTFITLTNGRGQVLVSQSAGYCKIKSKKKKRSPDTLKAIAYSVARAARLKNIRYIYKMFSKNRHIKSRRAIYQEFKRAGLLILVNVIVKSRPHSLHQRRKKIKRL